MIWTMIILMTVVIFTSRYLFIAPRLPIKLSAKAQQFLSFSAPAVMTAIMAPIIFVQQGEFNFSLNNPFLICAVVAVLLAYFTRNTLLTVIVSMGLFFVIY